MTQPAQTMVGVEPWLPWPFSASRWWTAPVPAQRLAAVRIGLAAVLLFDVVSSYLPYVEVYFGPRYFGNAHVVGWYQRPPRLSWSILQGVQSPLLSSLVLVSWLALTCWLGVEWWGRLSARKRAEATGAPGASATALWLLAGVVAVLGIWSRALVANDKILLPLSAVPPWALASVWLGLHRWMGSTADHRPSSLGRWVWLAWIVTSLLIMAGLWLWLTLDGSSDVPVYLRWITQPWDQEPFLVWAAMWLWIGAIGLLLVGYRTGLSAAAAWILTVSFAGLNPHIDNAGDVVRGIILFHLMLSPCAAAWSVDAWLARQRGQVCGDVFVHPWPLRLLFIQMIFIYFVNGIYKVVGEDWLSGDSMYYVLCDLTLTRFSIEQMPLPLWSLRLLSWSVLMWEVGFPLWVALRPTRVAALVFGALFHVGITLTMELGGFGPYMLVLYLPLLPWERFGRRSQR